MASHIAALGVLMYQTFGGRSFTFPGDTNVRISARQVMSSDGRTIKYVEYTMTANGWLFSSDLSTASGTVDGAFDATKEILSQAGGILTITGKGFGDWYINRDTGTNRDVLFGPTPKVLDWEPFGNIVCRFKWEVKFTLPWKKNVGIGSFGILDYSWSTSYKYDSEGFCNRTISGEIDIVGSRFYQQSLVDKNFNIEGKLRDILRVDCPIGMHRTGHEIIINAAKTKATFSFTDEADRGLTFPPGIADMDIYHEMHAQAEKKTIAAWVWVFNVQATPEAKFGTSYGYKACLRAFQERFQFMIRNLINSKGAIMPFPVSIKVGENVKTRTSTLTCAWLIQAVAGSNGAFMPTDILARSGMWQPFSWTAQDHKRTADGALGPNATGGFTQMAMDHNQNIILNLSGLAPYIPDPGLATGNYKIQTPPGEDELVIQPFGAYMEFEVYFAAKTAGDRWVNYPLTLNKNAPNQVSGAHIQDVSHPYNQYMLIGHIIRCGIPPAGIPEISSIGGKKAVIPAGEKAWVVTRPVQNCLGMVLWRTDFRVPYTPTNIDVSNPIKKTDAGNNGSRGKPPGNTVLKIQDNKLVEVPADMTAK